MQHLSDSMRGTANARLGALGRVGDVLTAAVYSAVAIAAFLPAGSSSTIVNALQSQGVVRDLTIGAGIEAGLLLLTATLTDLATRFTRRPKLWFIIPLLAMIIVMTPGALFTIQVAVSAGGVALLPLLLSAFQRLALLWTMPSRTPLEKMTARALVGNRVTTGLGVIAGFVLMMVFAPGEFTDRYGAGVFFTLWAFHFTVAAIDTFRVRSARFAAHPSVLFRFDLLGVEYLDGLYSGHAESSSGQTHRAD